MSDENRFSSRTEEALRRAGWFPGRVLSETQLKEWLVVEWPTQAGYHFQTRMFSAAWHILREFGGLTIEITRKRDGFHEHKSQFIFDPVQGIAHTQAYNWPLLEWESDGSVYPIGCWLDGTTDDSAIAVDGRGRIIVVEFDKCLGDNIDKALHFVVHRDAPFKELEVDPGKGREAAEVFPLMRERLGLNGL